MTLIPHILNLAAIVCGLAVASCIFNPKETVGMRVFWGVFGVLTVLRGVL